LDIHRILAELKAERDRIDQAIAAVGNISSARPRRGRPPGKSTGRRRKHRLTPEGRKRLSEMMKKRWAERRRKAA
jgi:Spy/CpxP family protein refolding chaperone